MQIHQLKLVHKGKKSRRVGRGGKRGTYSGRGIKGQKARAGAKIRPAEREILKKIPKLRGYKFKSFYDKPVIVNLYVLDRKFKSGDTVSPDSLLRAGLVARIKGKIPQIKILGKGESKKKFIFKGVLFSKSLAERLKSL